ncbi:hypothetical protein [Ralstonia pickettii]|uniref:hypothetical protein n=1 Tax=Ralstonia pickettii TaxID=329 RepID=UPI000818B92A|nr:hypothetical protein [Ralstonia pickettii]OCS47055.1 hypothetical protein BEK67_04345 [Ralstonia pickettii]
MIDDAVEEQTSLADMAHVLRTSAKWILAACASGLILGVLAWAVIPQRWTAQMTFQIGQLTLANPRGNSTKVPLENQLTAMERFNQPTFKLGVLTLLGLPKPSTGNKTADLVFDSLKASTQRSPDLITVQASGYTREEALAAVNAAFKEFSATHIKLFEQSAEAVQHELARALAGLSAAEADYRAVAERLKFGYTSAADRDASAKNILVSNTLTLLRAQISDLQQQVDAYQDALAPVQSYPTRTVTPAYASERPSTSGWAVWALSGAVFGLVISAALALLRDSLRNARKTH